MSNAAYLPGIQKSGIWNAEKLLFWIGAGVSYSRPTNLPLGFRLTAFTLEETCGTRISKRLFRIWNNVTLTNKTNLGVELSPIPRLEAILDVVRGVEIKCKSSTYSFFSGFRAFDSAPPNFLHYKLAALTSEGATVITPNFDTCIESAWRELSNSHKSLSIYNEVYDGAGLTKFLIKDQSRNGEIWHYHGTSKDPNTLGATVTAIKAGFSSEVKSQLIEKLNSCDVVIFIGYSFSDGFDVNPFFLSLPKGFFDHTKAIFIQYEHGQNLTKLDPICTSHKQRYDFERIQTILECFASVEFYQGESRDIFEEGEECDFIASKNYDWESSFKSEANLAASDKIQPLMICSLVNYFGINVGLVSPTILYKMKRNIRYYEKLLFLDQITVSLRRQGLSIFEKKYHLEKQDDKGQSDLLGYYYSRGDYYRAQRYALSLEQLRSATNDNQEELSWVHFTSLASYCRPIIDYYLKNVFVRHISIKHVNAIQDLMIILGKLNSKPLRNILYVNQLGTSLRFQFLFYTLLNKGEINSALQKKATEIYSENTSIPGYISVFRDIAINYFLSAKLFKRKDCLSKSWVYAKTSFRISFLVGEVPGLVRAFLLLILIGLENFFFIIWSKK